jgi:co-chaperonin GroES (HSP10)
MKVLTLDNSTIKKPKIKPVGGKMLVLPDEAKERMSSGGIFIPQTATSQLEEATVVLVSANVSEFISEGERVLYPKGSGVDREIDGVKYKFLTGPTATEQGDIWAII